MKLTLGVDIATFIDDCDIPFGRYIVFKDGRIYDAHKGLYKNVYDNGGGYKTFGIFCRKRGLTRLKYVHRVVLEAFKGKEVGRDYVNHIDGDKSNNNLDNLEWVTAKENTKHGVLKGRVNGVNRVGLSLNRVSAKDLFKVVKFICEGVSISKIAEEIGSKRGTITTILNGRSRVKDMAEVIKTSCNRDGCRCVKYRRLILSKYRQGEMNGKV